MDKGKEIKDMNEVKDIDEVMGEVEGMGARERAWRHEVEDMG